MTDIFTQDGVSAHLGQLFLAVNGAVRNGYILLSVPNKQVSPLCPWESKVWRMRTPPGISNDCALSFISGQQKQVGPDLFKDFYTIWKETEAEAQEVCVWALFISPSFHTANWGRNCEIRMKNEHVMHVRRLEFCLQECKLCVSCYVALT